VVTLAFAHRQPLGGGDGQAAAQAAQVEEGVLTSLVSGRLGSAQFFAVVQIAREACARLAALGRMSVAKAFQPLEPVQ
jgi:hypothetical protein